jgi:hypothetical protein
MNTQIFFLSFFTLLGFELRALPLLGWLSATRATPPASFCFSYFWDTLSHLCSGCSRIRSSFLCFLCSWDIIPSFCFFFFHTQLFLGCKPLYPGFLSFLSFPFLSFFLFVFSCLFVVVLRQSLPVQLRLAWNLLGSPGWPEDHCLLPPKCWDYRWPPPHLASSSSFLFYFIFSSTMVWTQDLMLARQAFYHWSHTPTLFCLFLRWGLAFLPGASLRWWSSHRAGTTGVSHSNQHSNPSYGIPDFWDGKRFRGSIAHSYQQHKILLSLGEVRLHTWTEGQPSKERKNVKLNGSTGSALPFPPIL